MSVPQEAHPQAISHILCEFFLRSCLLNIRHRLCVMLCIFWFRCLKQLPQESIWPQEASWSEVKKKLWELFLKKIFLNNKVIILCFFFFSLQERKTSCHRHTWLWDLDFSSRLYQVLRFCTVFIPLYVIYVIIYHPFLVIFGFLRASD